MTIDRKKCKEITDDVEKALRAVAEKHGLDLKMLGGKFDGDMFQPKVQFLRKGGDSAETKAFKEYSKFGLIPGLTAEDLGAKFTSGGKTFVVSGFRPKALKSILTKCVEDGKTYIHTPEIVAALLMKIRAAGLTK